jgi:ribonuclease BN (tRNA processing enzyme)
MRDRRALRRVSGAIVSLAVVWASSAVRQHAGIGAAGQTQIVLLGTGTPRVDPQRSGPATAIVVNDTPYVVDAGPGVVRRAGAARDKGIRGLAPEKLATVFITHLHSDHTVGLPDFIFTSWVEGRNTPVKAYGPAGLEEMTGHIMLAWRADIDIRTKGMEQRSQAGAKVEAHDVKPGLIYQDANVKVTAFPTVHGDWPQTLGYRFNTPDRSIVISGDANPSPALIENCQRCDVLIHEVFAETYEPAAVKNWPAYRAKFHTTTTQLAEIANKTQPGLLVLYHRGVRLRDREISDEQYLTEIQRTYRGRVVVAQDLDVY